MDLGFSHQILIRGGHTHAQTPLMFENDSRHTLLYMCEPPVAQEGCEAAVDELLGTPIGALVFNLGFGNAFLHDTQVADHWGPETAATAQFRPEDDHHWDHLVFQRAYRNAQQLIAEGRDLLHIVCDRAQAKGLLIYPSLQVQADLGEGLRIGDTQLADFARPEVREMRFALIEETLQNYPVDGFELNLNHYAGGAFFHPDDMERGRSIFTDWLQRVREAVKQSGPDRELALRIPTSIAGCRSIGLDPETWIREGIADVLVAENFASMSLIDATADFRPLIAAAQDAECRIHGVIRNNVDSDRLGAAPIAMVRAAATNYWAQGVDGLNLVHWAGNWPYGPSFYEQLRELPHPDVMAVKDKIYAIPTPTGRSTAQPKTEPGLVMQLPASLSLEQPVALELPISDDLPRWGAAGRVHEVILRIRLMRATDRDRLSFQAERGRITSAYYAQDRPHLSDDRAALPLAFELLVRLPAGRGPLAGAGNQRRGGHPARARPGGYAVHLCTGRGTGGALPARQEHLSRRTQHRPGLGAL